jgi:ABC-2 type transport system permease protein
MFRDTTALTGRLMKAILRSPDTIITVAITPLALFLLFRYVFGGAIQGTGNYTNYLLPGILLITVASGVAYTAFRLFNDKTKGINARFSTMPIARSAVLWSHVLTSLVSNLVTAVIIIGVGFAMGFRPQATFVGWLGFIGVLALFTLALTWLSVIPGLTASSVEGASAFSYPLIFLPGPVVRGEPAGDVDRRVDALPHRGAGSRKRHLGRAGLDGRDRRGGLRARSADVQQDRIAPCTAERRRALRV